MPASDFTDRFIQAMDAGTALVEAPSSRDNVTSFARSVAAGLSDYPKWLHCSYLYDAEGSRLFEEITAQP
ncbi:MAG TPA: L-histidine N(alpha)-methyltransferase, partial [Gemmatimonadota bacterium]|nr:L-histidine N(alpha)-methyltransferase [Gemmatimonadota bacterium]